jgi:hypothetical protein
VIVVKEQGRLGRGADHRSLVSRGVDPFRDEMDRRRPTPWVMHTRADRPRSTSSSQTDPTHATPGKAPLDEAMGRPLPGGVRGAMEHAFQTDFSDVRISEGGLATSLGAVAVAQGNTIDFARGAFDPESVPGREVIGHELAHVVQQRQGRVTADAQAKGLPTNSDHGLEAEADALGARAARGEIVAQSYTPAVAASGPAQFLRKDKTSTEPIDIATLDHDACVYYLKEAKKSDTSVVFEPGDVDKLRARVAALGGGSVLGNAAGNDPKQQIATEILLNPAEPGRTDDRRLGEVMSGGDPLDCGSTAKLLGEIFLGEEGAEEQQRHNGVANRKAERELAIPNNTTNDNKPTKEAEAIGLVAGTNTDFPVLASRLLQTTQPFFIQMSVKSVPAALGHTFVIEVFGRGHADEPVLGKVHQSFVNTYPLHAWLGDPKNGVIDVIDYLGELATMCADAKMDTYLDKFLISENKAVPTANRKRAEFIETQGPKAYKIGISFSAQPFDSGQAAQRLAGRVTTQDVKSIGKRIDNILDPDDY